MDEMDIERFFGHSLFAPSKLCIGMHDLSGWTLIVDKHFMRDLLIKYPKPNEGYRLH